MSSLKNIFYRLFGCCIPHKNNKYNEYNHFDNIGVRNTKKIRMLPKYYDYDY